MGRPAEDKDDGKAQCRNDDVVVGDFYHHVMDHHHYHDYSFRHQGIYQKPLCLLDLDQIFIALLLLFFLPLLFNHAVARSLNHLLKVCETGNACIKLYDGLFGG